MLQKLNFLLLRAQLVRNDANTVLGRVRPGRSRELRIGRYQSVHQVLGYADVRHVLGDQHRRFTQSTDRHDESFLPIDLRECYLHLTLYRHTTQFCSNSFFLPFLLPKKRNAPTSSGSSPGASFGSATSRRVARSHPRSTSSPPRRASGTWANGCTGNCADTAERPRRST